MLKPQVLAALLIVAVLAVAVVWIDGESGGEAQPAEPVLTRWGNVTILAPPRDSGLLVDQSEQGGRLSVSISQFGSDEAVVIDASDGTILQDTVTGTHRQLVDEVLASISVTVIDALTAPWPYAETSPPAASRTVGVVRIIQPDPAAGILMRWEFGDGTFLHYVNGRSTLSIDVTTGTLEPSTSIHGEDQEAFDRLLSNVVLRVGAIMIDGETDGEAEPAEPVLTRWGNVAVLAPDRDSGILVDQTQPGDQFILRITQQGLEGSVLIDAMTGSILKDDVTGGDRQGVDDVISTITVSDMDREGAPWPYSNAEPLNDYERVGDIKFPWPDPASGIVVRIEFNYGGGQFVHFDNTRSTLSFDALTAQIDGSRTSVHPDDQAAFDEVAALVRLFDES